jgi:hypothetical protein
MVRRLVPSGESPNASLSCGVMMLIRGGMTTPGDPCPLTGFVARQSDTCPRIGGGRYWRRMADGGWRMADGGWRMADGGWRMADGWGLVAGGWGSGCITALALVGGCPALGHGAGRGRRSEAWAGEDCRVEGLGWLGRGVGLRDWTGRGVQSRGLVLGECDLGLGESGDCSITYSAAGWSGSRRRVRSRKMGQITKEGICRYFGVRGGLGVWHVPASIPSDDLGERFGCLF